MTWLTPDRAADGQEAAEGLGGKTPPSTWTVAPGDAVPETVSGSADLRPFGGVCDDGAAGEPPASVKSPLERR